MIGIRDSALKSGGNPGLGMVIFLRIIRNYRAYTSYKLKTLAETGLRK